MWRSLFSLTGCIGLGLCDLLALVLETHACRPLGVQNLLVLCTVEERNCRGGVVVLASDSPRFNLQLLGLVTECNPLIMKHE